MQFERSYYKDIGNVSVFAIRYQSNGHWVNGFLAFPKSSTTKLPGIIYNRGGSFEFGVIDDHMLKVHVAKLAAAGYVVIASQYSGNGGSEGHDEIGGADVDDVIALKSLLSDVSVCDDRRIGMIGFSRGGMMTYKALTRLHDLQAAVVVGAVADLDRSIALRPEMQKVYEKGFGNTQEGRRERSAVHFTDAFSPSTPILIMHGSDDWRVSPQDSIDVSSLLLEANIPHKLMIFTGGDHALKTHFDEAWTQIIGWFDTYLKT